MPSFEAALVFPELWDPREKQVPKETEVCAGEGRFMDETATVDGSGVWFSELGCLPQDLPALDPLLRTGDIDRMASNKN